MKKIMRLSFMSLLIFSTGNSWAQIYLVLDKPGLVKRVRFEMGDQFHFIQKSTGYKIKGEITALTDSTIELESFDLYKLTDVSHVKLTKTGGLSGIRNGLASALPVAGVGYAAIDLINSGVIDQQTLSYSLPMIAIGVSMGLLGKRKLKINKNRRLFVINMNKGLQFTSD